MKSIHTLAILAAAAMIATACTESTTRTYKDGDTRTTAESPATQTTSTSSTSKPHSSTQPTTEHSEATDAPSSVSSTSSSTATHAELSVTSFSAKVQGIGASGQIRMAQDSVIWVSISKMVELGRAMATPDSVWISAPLLGHNFAGTYAQLSSRLGRTVSFAELQRLATAPDADQRLSALAAELGIDATVSIRKRQQVESITFPFNKK